MNQHQTLLQKIGLTLLRGAFPSRELDFSREEDVACVAAQFGGLSQMQERYGGLYALFQHTVQLQAAPRVGEDKGFQDKAKVLDLGYDAASGTAYAMGTMTLTMPAMRLYLTLDIYADGTQVAHHAKFFSSCLDGEVQIQSKPLEPLPAGKQYTAILHATWEPYRSGMLRSQVASDTVTAGSTDLVKSFTVTHPRHIRSAASEAITVAYARSAPDRDYCYPETRDPVTKNEKVLLDMEGQIDLVDGYHVSAVEDGGAVLSCQGFGDILYLGGVGYAQSGAAFFPVNGGTSIGWKLDQNWDNEIPDSVRFGNRKHDLEFSFSFRCAEDQTLHDVLLTSKGTELILSQPHVQKISQLHLYWGCLAAGTKVTMADGSKKNIEELQVGDLLRSPTGGTVKVKRLVPGTEEMIYRVHMENGLEVRATRTHPLGTEKGFAATIDLNSQSQLVTELGVSSVLYCYPETYQGAVYGLELEGGDSFFADGVASGSNRVMGQMADRWAEEQLSVERDDAVEEERARLEADFQAGLL